MQLQLLNIAFSYYYIANMENVPCTHDTSSEIIKLN